MVVGEHKALIISLLDKEKIQILEVKQSLFVISTDVNENIIYVGQGKTSRTL